jgi:MFS family permease
MARLSYPRAGEPRPAALPPGERTVGQLVAESIRTYGEHFVRCLGVGVAPAVLAVVTARVSRNLSLVLAPTLYGALLSAAYVAASVLVLEQRPPLRRLALAWAVGWAVFAPVPFLVLAFVLPALGWLAAIGLVVPVLVVEELAPRAALARAWRLGRADYVHALGSLATLAIVVFLTQTVLAFILRGAGGAAVSTAFFLANVVVSPLLFIGAALLYVDQVARVE